MMEAINPKTHMVMDKDTFAEIAGAQEADLEASSVIVKRRRDYSGVEEVVTLYRPAGIAIVRRR